jgi:hypothetical protein
MNQGGHVGFHPLTSMTSLRVRPEFRLQKQQF